MDSHIFVQKECQIFMMTLFPSFFTGIFLCFVIASKAW